MQFALLVPQAIFFFHFLVLTVESRVNRSTGCWGRAWTLVAGSGFPVWSRPNGPGNEWSNRCSTFS